MNREELKRSMHKMNRGELSDYYELLRFIGRVLRFVGRTLFDWRGRADRKTYFVVVGFGAFWANVCHQPVMDFLWNRSTPRDPLMLQDGVDRSAYDYINWGVPILLIILRVVFTCKRLHDFNASGWWVLLIAAEYLFWKYTLPASVEGIVVAFALNMALVIVCGIIKGTDGANRFGEKPTWGGWTR